MLALSHHSLFDMLDSMSVAPCPRYTYSRVRAAPKITDLDAEYVLTLKLPGVRKADISLTAKDGILTIAHWRLRIPRDADVLNAKAKHVDGILTVSLPKKELEGVHEGVTCDKSGESPISGKRYHLPHHDYDLCQAEYDKLGEREKALYQCILPPPKRVKLDVPVASAVDETTPSEEEDEEETDDDGKGKEEAPRPYTFTLNAAGVRPADISVTIDDTLMAIKGETKTTGARLQHFFRLPRDADAEKTNASSVDGLLTVSVPKKVLVTVDIPIEGGAVDEGNAEPEAPAADEDADEDAVMV